MDDKTINIFYSKLLEVLENKGEYFFFITSFEANLG